MAAPISSGLFLLGGAASAAFAVVKHSSGKKRQESRPPHSSDVACPATPSMSYPRSTASWLRVVGSSSPSKRSSGSTEACRSPTVTSVSVHQEGIPMRALEAGSLVCFYTSLGELVTVKRENKIWELHACLAPSPPNAEGSFRLPYFPAEAVFAVTRNGSKIGFRSLGADGRSLQAVKAPDVPHRVANHNFGSWESWEVTSSGLVNVQWRHKVLGLEIREVRVVAREDIRKTERQQMHASRDSRTQVKSLDRQLSDTERRLQEMVSASQRQTSLAQNEIENLQQQLSQAIAGRRSAEADAMRRAATLKQLEHRLGELSSEKDSADDACKHVTLRVRDLEAEMMKFRSRHADQVASLQHDQARDASATKGAGMTALQLQLAESERRGAQNRLELQQVQSQAAADQAGVQAQMQRTLQAKDSEIQGLLADRSRLEAALSSINGQITAAASPARPAPPQNKALFRASVDSATLRGLRRALEEANLNTTTSSPAGRPSQTPALPKQPAMNEQASVPNATPASDSENQQPGDSQKSPPVSISPDAPRPASTGPRQQAPVPAPSGQHSSMWPAQPPCVRAPSGLYAMLTPAGTGQSGALYDLLKSADNSPRSSYATPRILTPNCTPRVAEARVSDTVIWKDSVDSSADSHVMTRLPSLPSSHASADLTHPHRHKGGSLSLNHAVDAADLGPSEASLHRATSNRSVAGSWAAPQRGAEWQAGREASDRTRLVQHFGPHAEDVEHMGERYVDDQMPGAVQVPRCEDPRPRFAEFALLEQPSSESLGQGRPPGPTQVEIVVQGHEEFDDEITLAGSGRMTPSANMSAHSEPQDGGSHLLDAEQQLDGDDHGRTNVASPSQPGSGSVSNQDHTDAEVQEVLAHAKQPLPSLTPLRKPVHRSANLRHSWSQQASPSNSAGSDDHMNSKKRSSFLGRPLKELGDLW
ncbi:hypothetical protein WJX79_010101 [Trebouxia sp. C0005]